MKARIIGTTFEIEVIPYFPEGMFAGFTDVTGKLQPGMIVYKPSDLEFLETPPKLKPEVDWEAFRREAAKDILCTLMQTGIQDTWKIMSMNAIDGADELIRQLKEDQV